MAFFKYVFWSETGTADKITPFVKMNFTIEQVF